MSKIAVLVSGGVDSAVVVHELAQQAQHDLQLFYIRIGMDNDEGDCSAEEDIEMCNLIAHRYGLPLEVVSLHEEYWDNVMDYALRTVKAGLTPNPDMMCNRMIKFGYFEQRWGKDFDFTATGHYATTCELDGIKYLATAVDPVKDQTDFLAQITYDQLKHLIFPIGSMPKARVREIAQQVKLPNAMRKDSQGICFLGQINYNDFIWYVVKKNVQDNAIFVSNGYGTSKQYGREIHLDEMHFISGNPWQGSNDAHEITFKNRHTPHFAKGHLLHIEGNQWLINSDEDIQGIAPGQFAVIYDRDQHLCYGSGVITL